MRKQLPVEGNERVIKKFALFPIICNNNEWAWLEWVYIKQKYFYSRNGIPEGWQNLAFVNKEEN
jgi:hypothetical protein